MYACIFRMALFSPSSKIRTSPRVWPGRDTNFFHWSKYSSTNLGKLTRSFIPEVALYHHHHQIKSQTAFCFLTYMKRLLLPTYTNPNISKHLMQNGKTHDTEKMLCSKVKRVWCGRTGTPILRESLGLPRPFSNNLPYTSRVSVSECKKEKKKNNITPQGTYKASLSMQTHYAQIVT